MEKRKVSSISDLEKLYSELTQESKLPQSCYETTLLISNVEFGKLIYFQLASEPFIEVAKYCGMASFGIYGSEKRFYLGHINVAGHGARFVIRPVLLDQLLDVVLMKSLNEDYCQRLESGAVKELAFEI